MKNCTDYNATIAQLGTGDRFRLSPHGAVTLVANVDWSADGSVVYVKDSDGETRRMATYSRCHVTEWAPECRCRRRFEMCERGCVWPEGMLDLFYA